jgi:predicted dehydrogenase
MDNSFTRVAVIGCGKMARGHIGKMLHLGANNSVAVVCEPSPEAYQLTQEVFSEAGQPIPPNQPDLARLLDDYAGQLDAAFIITPHAYHCQQAMSCLNAGLDVLLEKPMVMNAQEAVDLIAARDRSQRLLVVAFNGSLSPRIRHASSLLRSGELGEIQSIAAMIWENWELTKRGHWKQDPAIAGGGFMFDTGAHMLNTIADLAGQDFVEVAAWLNTHDGPVDIIGAAIGKLKSGALVTMHACGHTVKSCASDIRVFCSEAILRTGAWGEYLEIQRDDQLGFTETAFQPIEFPNPPTVWEQFLAVRAGKIENPSPPEIGLRMAKVWDAIQLSASQSGRPVTIS